MSIEVQVMGMRTTTTTDTNDSEKSFKANFTWVEGKNPSKASSSQQATWRHFQRCTVGHNNHRLALASKKSALGDAYGRGSF
jgi:hypothetical protein